MGCCVSGNTRESFPYPLTWGGKKVIVSPGKILNLDTSREIAFSENKWKIRGIEITGSKENYNYFLQENGLKECGELNEDCVFNYAGCRGICEVSRVIDGDTYDIRFSYNPFKMLPLKGKRRMCLSEKNKGMNLTITYRTRLYGIDVYEKNTPLGMEANEYVKRLIEGKKVNYIMYEFDKFGRILIDIFIGETELSKILISAGYGYEYFGGEKK